jgi:hypothetical protein
MSSAFFLRKIPGRPRGKPALASREMEQWRMVVIASEIVGGKVERRLSE